MSTPRQLIDSLGVALSGAADDSRQVRPGDLFIAYPGDLADGRRYIGDAIARGAVAVLWQPGGDFTWNPAWTVPNRPVEALRPLAGPLAHALYGYPSEALSLIAVTGTNGKTTVSQCLAQAYAKPCAVIGTLGAGFPGELVETGFTTPEATVLMRCLAEFRAHDAAACALEASSIGIEEGRMNGAHVDVAVFTNFTRDHLDYHGSMEAYAAAKEKLFRWPRLRSAVINLDDPLGPRLAGTTTALRVLGYGIGDERRDVLAQVRAEQLEETPSGQRFTLILPNGRGTVDTTLVGRYNVANLLAVAAVLYDAGLPATEVVRRLVELTPPPGRMERVGGNGEPLVVIDYAHSPDALDNALSTLRVVAGARGGCLAVVFGCGGDRDRGKRPQMAEIASRRADRVLVTSDNPRREEPAAIVADIIAGLAHGEVELDRAAAIRKAVREADARDVILLAGKGHEAYQEIAGVRHPFSDVEQAQQALELRRDPNPNLQEAGA
ncbi:UDP-N-acetylmuramoyl-L-alanyl-D-glutamate--2,6-diaminopimelate ligase [Azonexus sp.]|jgi:UDP-N-acetylmuramoyl-L-alanyl-D-glutamate--2,6-diaminopimelate ligase|uniref:UDP-N-acetylmuramoyl-L-alanyl-D-glutamate--2, 6-diaminopimelate ligase n=1 Tax=Azonexus sp. TaxID=1872668 RepID=UPI00282930C8|nr:UDP-N-acetylmuramoyl-L-alanyl-D-glutamate--2,6-diaminopimelate ligase [Azonexus sp.]MDR1996623.1 UDP-N-acetylmuramoyl-L-alanyl-D-glutamate--2,6-diaminopimelate ligase [Azonexus sp.]